MEGKEGILRKQTSGRWAVCRTGREPVEIKSGKVFRVEVDGVLRVTRMRHTPRRGYYAADGYELATAFARPPALASDATSDAYKALPVVINVSGSRARASTWDLDGTDT